MLNRTTRVVKQPSAAPPPDDATVTGYVNSQTTLADMARQLAAGMEARGRIKCQHLYAAEGHMRQASGELAASQFPAAADRQKEALAELTKAREEMRIAFGNSPSGDCRNFDREQAQKLRRPRRENQQEQAEQLAGRLRRLASEEQFVYATLGGQPAESQSSKEPSSPSSSSASSPGEPPAQGKDVQSRQQDVVQEAYDLKQTMDRLDALSELARTRMDRAVSRGEQASGALARGSRSEAAQSAGEAGSAFAELAQHVRGLLAGEAAQRLAAARDLAGQLARRQRELGAQAERSGGGPSASGGGRLGELADRQSQLAEGGRTLDDLLRALAHSKDAGFQERSADIERLRSEPPLELTLRQMEELVRALRAGGHHRRWSAGAGSEAGDIAGRLEGLAQALDALYRAIVAPRVTELVALERRAAALRQRLAALQSQEQITAWHHEADALARDAAQQEVAHRAAESLQEAMQQQGWGGGPVDWNWARGPGGGPYAGPSAYSDALGTLIVALQTEVRELLLADLRAAGDEPTPPQYQRLVDRYFRVLSEETGAP